MKKEDLFENLNDVKDEYVSEAGETAKKRTPWLRWGAAAACVAVAVLAGTRLSGPAVVPPAATGTESAKPTAPAATSAPVPTAPATQPPAEVNGLPVLPVDDFSGAFGFEGLLAYSADELADSRPWKGEELETLPVYKNQNPTDQAGYVTQDWAILEAQVRDVAARLGLAGELTITDDLTPQALEKMDEDAPRRPYEVTGTAEGVTIRAQADQMVGVEFDPTLALPEGLPFDESDADALRKVGEYLKEEYADLLGMEDPVVAVQDGDYTFHGEGPHYSLHIYDGGGDLTQQMVGHDLKSAWLCENEGGLWLIWLDAYDLSEKAGDYPILTAEEATDLLCDGSYITTVPAEFPGRDKIVRTELMYRTERTAEYFMPYYRFLVEVDDPAVESQDAVELGLKTYGAYYVPAVRGEYLTGMPVWDGHFN